MERLRNTYNKYWYAGRWSSPSSVVLAVLVFYPLFQGVWMSFTNINEGNQVGGRSARSPSGGADPRSEPQPVAVHRPGQLRRPALRPDGEFWQNFRITLIWTFTCVFPLHPRPGPGRSDQPVDQGPRCLPRPAHPAVGGPRVRLGLLVEVHLRPRQRSGERVISGPRRHPDRVPRHRAQGPRRRHHRQRLARRALHDGRDARRHAVDPG